MIQCDPVFILSLQICKAIRGETKWSEPRSRTVIYEGSHAFRNDNRANRIQALLLKFLVSLEGTCRTCVGHRLEACSVLSSLSMHRLDLRSAAMAKDADGKIAVTNGKHGRF